MIELFKNKIEYFRKDIKIMKIFISYNWKNEDEMKIIDEAFKKKELFQH